MAGQEAAGGIVIDERIVGQPLDGPALGAGVAECVPRWQQVRILLVELVFEAAEGAFALDGPCQPAPGTFIGKVPAKSAMSWYQTQDGSGSMQTRSSSSRSTGVWPSMPVSAVQNAICPVCGLISHRCS